MKSQKLLKTILLTVLGAALMPVQAETITNLNDTIELVRATYQKDRQAFIASKLGLAEKEEEKFRPLYKSYRTEMDKLGDELVKLVLEYGDYFPNVPEDRAAQLLKRYLELEDQLVDVRQKYVKRAAKIMPASKALRWAQLESHMDIALRLQLASRIPVIGDR